MSITAAQVKELRELTGAGILECKKALQETNGDVQAAIEAMRKSGKATAAKKAGRIAAEGSIIIKISDDNQSAAIAEVNCETDFVARDETFLAFANQLTEQALQGKNNDITALMEKPFDAESDDTIEHFRQTLIAKIGENIQVRRIEFRQTDGYIASYMHGSRIGVIVDLSVDNAELGKDIAMHIAATGPEALSVDDVPQVVIDKEKEIFAAQAKESGKPQDIIEKMTAGRINKFLKEICLLTQPFVKNPEQTIGDLLKSSNAKVNSFVRFEVGEGIEKKTENFAEEVMAQIQAGD